MLAIAMHILYQRRYLVLLLFFFMLMTYFIGLPIMIFFCLVLFASFFRVEPQNSDIRIYRTLPVSRINLSRIFWVFSVLASPVCALIMVGLHFAGDPDRSIAEYQSDLFLKDFPIINFIVLGLLSIQFILKFTRSLPQWRFGLIRISSMAFELIIEILILVPALALILFITNQETSSQYVFPPVLVTSVACLIFSWRRNDRTFCNGRLCEMDPKNEAHTVSNDYPVTFNNAHLSFYWILFKPFPICCGLWIIYYLVFTHFSSNGDVPSFFYLVSNLFFAYVILFIVSQYTLLILPILVILPIRRFLVGLYLIGFPALCCGAGIGIGMTLEILLPNAGIVTIPGWYNLTHCVLLAPIIIFLGLNFGITGIFASLLLALINLIFYFDMTWNFDSFGWLLGFFLLVNLIVACYAIYHVFTFLISAQKAAKFDTRLDLKGFG